MDENLARLNRIYPNSGFVRIQPYNPDLWKQREYDSSFDSKAAMNRWKTVPLTYEEASKAVDDGYRVGWIVPKGYVIVDIDNKDDARSQERIEYILNKFEVAYSYNYTSKGMHILFRDPTESIKTDAKMKCSINIEVDTRANETGYIVLPCNDPHRCWGKWSDIVEDIPYFLKPVLKDVTASFIGMADGDGRNNALFKWRSQLEKTNKLTPTEVEKSIRIINENLFEIPMSNQELFKTVLREKDSKREVGAEKDNKYNELADAILAKYDILASYNDFYTFDGTYYKTMRDIDLEKIIHYEVSKNVSKAGRKEILEFLKIKTQVDVSDFNKDWNKIACKNGVINLVTGELEAPNKTELNTIYIPYNYNTDPPYSPRIDQFMKEFTNGDLLKIEFLYQIAGYCLLKKNIFEKFFIFQGAGGTGKSTYSNLLAKLVGGDVNCSHIGLADFDKDYYLASIKNKLVNVDDDVVDGKILENTGRFKSIISGNVISVRQIYREVEDIIPFCTCIFSCNKLPRIMDKTSGLYRRMILVTFNNKVEHPDPLFINKVSDTDMEYLLFKAVEGIKKAIEEGHLRVTMSEAKLLQIFKRHQSPLNEWLYESDIRLKDIVNVTCLQLYKIFAAWCNENGYNKVISSQTFKEDVSSIYDVAVGIQQDSTAQIFVKRGEYNENWKPFEED